MVPGACLVRGRVRVPGACLVRVRVRVRVGVRLGARRVPG